MSTTSLEQTTTTADSGRGSGDRPPADTKQPGTSGRMYRVVWRWHFYAGMIVAPVLIVVAATGGLYIFKDDLAAVVYPGVNWRGVLPANKIAKNIAGIEVVIRRAKGS